MALLQYIFTHKQYTEQHNSFGKSVSLAPSLRGIPWHLPCNRGKSMEKPQQDSQIVPAGTMKTEYTEQNIHHNKIT